VIGALLSQSCFLVNSRYQPQQPKLVKSVVSRERRVEGRVITGSSVILFQPFYLIFLLIIFKLPKQGAVVIKNCLEGTTMLVKCLIRF